MGRPPLVWLRGYHLSVPAVCYESMYRQVSLRPAYCPV